MVLVIVGLGMGGEARGQTPDSFNPGVDGPVLALAVQPDGKLIVGGDFTFLGGQARSSLGRVNADGTLDTGFAPAADDSVWAIAVQPDGKILVGGDFTMLGGQTREHLARLNPDGSVDMGFNPGTDGPVYSLALQPDGAILVGGFFGTLGGQTCNNLGRLDSAGVLDLSFVPDPDGTVGALAIQPDGRIVVGGSFGLLGGDTGAGLGRLLINGTRDTNFTATVGGSPAHVLTLGVQPDGAILVGGKFSTLAGQSCNNLGRLNTDMTLDTGFNPSPNEAVNCLALQTDGKILVGGEFTSLGGQTRTGIGRLNASGTIDSYNPRSDASVTALAIQADGKVLVGGYFANLGTQVRSNFARLGNVPATQSLTLDDSTLTWLRGGSSPEIWRTIFETTTDGVTWSSLGAGTRINGGWQLNGASVSPEYPIRARGFISGAGMSSWLVENVLGTAPAIVTQPVSRTDGVGTTATFTVSASGTQPLMYQWRQNGINLVDGGKVSGAQTANLLLTDVSGAEAGAYSVVVSNLLGGVTSVAAVLTVVDPFLLVQPESRTNDATTVATFTVTATGTPTLSYQWRKGGINLVDGANLSGALGPTLTISNVLGADAGDYSVVIVNPYGSLTSEVATLTVRDPFISPQPLAQAVNLGDPVFLSVGVAATAPFSFQWRKDGVNIPGATDASLALASAQRADAGNYDVVVANSVATVTSSVATVIVNLALPDDFAAGADNEVYCLAEQKDGGIVVGGAFTNLGGVPCFNLGRVDAAGMVDPFFNPGANSNVNCLAVQPDGKILVGGGFTELAGQPCNFLGRLNADGSLDTGFQAGADNAVIALAVQPDGQILVGGAFTQLSGQTRNYLGRLNADGSLDEAFNPNPNNAVISLAVQPDGGILAGGVFTWLGGATRYYLGRLDADGILDPGFNPGASSWVYALVLQADGKILVGGVFTKLAGETRLCLGRLDAAGGLDTTFNPEANELVYSLAVQTDGKILLGGNFTTLGGQPHPYLGRLNQDGTVDNSFNAAADRKVYCLIAQRDGKVVAGGQFSTLVGQPRAFLGRLTPTDPVTDSLVFNETSLTWRREGTGPEAWRATFEAFTEATGWVDLGTGQRIAGGWQVTNRLYSTNLVVRARAWVAGGGLTSSILERNLPPLPPRPTILSSDGSPGFREGLFGFEISGSAGQVVRIEASTNLLDWSSTATILMESNSVYFSDPETTNFLYRFYRARFQ